MGRDTAYKNTTPNWSFIPVGLGTIKQLWMSKDPARVKLSHVYSTAAITDRQQSDTTITLRLEICSYHHVTASERTCSSLQER